MILRVVLAISILLAAAGTLYAETLPLRSVAHIHGIAADPADAQSLYLATHYGLYRTKADGTAKRVSTHRDDLMGFTPRLRQAGPCWP